MSPYLPAANPDLGETSPLLGQGLATQSRPSRTPFHTFDDAERRAPPGRRFRRHPFPSRFAALPARRAVCRHATVRPCMAASTFRISNRFYAACSRHAAGLDLRRSAPAAAFSQLGRHGPHGLPQDSIDLHARPARRIPRLPWPHFAGEAADRAIEIAAARRAAAQDRGQDRRSRPCITEHDGRAADRRHRDVEFVGEINEAREGEFLGNALALLFPIDWPEPFGLV